MDIWQHTRQSCGNRRRRTNSPSLCGCLCRQVDSWYSFINAESEDAFNEAVHRIIQNSYYTNGDAPEYGDRLLTLSTCYGSTRSSRLIIIAKEEKANGIWQTEGTDSGTDGGNQDEATFDMILPGTVKFLSDHHIELATVTDLCGLSENIHPPLRNRLSCPSLPTAVV